MATQNLGMGAMRNDWNSYFDGAKPGASTAWGGGTLTMGDNGEAKYSAQGALNGGTTINRNSIDNPASLQMLMAQAPGIAQQWKQQYGMDSGLNANDQAYWNNTLAQQGNQPVAAANTQATAQPAQPMQNLGMSTPQSSAQGAPQTGRNPYLQQVGQAMQAQSNQNLQQNVLPGIGQGAQAAGMYGSSRQGTAEGIAMGNAQTGLNSALANMYSQGYGQDQSYDLGLRNNNLGYANLDANNQQFGANFGLQSQNYQNQWANNSLNAANQMAQTPINQFNNFNNNASQIAGQGQTTSQTNQGNPWLGAIGGAQLGSQFGVKP